LIGAAYGGAAFISTYLFGREADIRGRKAVMEVGLIAASLAFAAQILATAPPFNTPLALGVLRFIAGFSAGIFLPALIATVYETRQRLGAFAAWGSLGWAAGYMGAGLIGNFQEIFLLSSLLFFAAFLLALKLPSVGGVNVRVPLLAVGVARRNFPVYLAYLLRHTGAAAIWIIFPLYLASLGASLFWIGALYAVNTVTQFLVMQRIDRFNSLSLILLGLSSSLITFSGYALTSSFYHIIPFQVTLGVGWACLYVGSLKFLLERNEERATASGLLISVINFSAVLGPLLGGAVSEVWGLKSPIYLAIALTLTATLFIGLESRRHTWAPAMATCETDNKC